MINLNKIDFFKSIVWNVSWSGGKDSTATIIKCHELDIPIQSIYYVDMRFNSDISSHLPNDAVKIFEMIEMFKKWGYEVIILKGVNYIDYYNYIIKKSIKHPERNNIKLGGVCAVRGCCMLSGLKIKALNAIKGHTLIGIASDEKKRLQRIEYPNYSLLKHLNITESECFNICRKYNMLLPIYKYTNREGCWFCPNASKDVIYHVKHEYTELYNIYMELLNNTPDIYIDIIKRRHNYLK